MKILPIILLLPMIFLAACGADNRDVPPFPPTPALQPTVTPNAILPTPYAPGNAATWDELQVTMDQLDVTQEYLTEFGSTRTPPADSKFLWVHVRLKNMSPIELEVPLSEHFSILYASTELKPTYGHRAGYTDYTVLGPVIFPDQQLEGWLRFDIPTAAELRELRFIFIPESSHVGTSFSSPDYPYAPDKPTYVWNCVP